MPTFAPAYRPTKAQQAFLTHEQKREAKKRKRDDEDDDDKSDASSSAQSSDSDDAKPYFDTPFPMRLSSLAMLPKNHLTRSLHL
jgi:hypothetical protein